METQEIRKIKKKRKIKCLEDLKAKVLI